MRILDTLDNEPTSQNLATFNFDALSADTIRYYKEFDEALRKSQVKKQDQCLVLFGVSGAGKTTLLARLLSDLPAYEFFEKATARSGTTREMVKIEGVTIGHTANSTTVVPKVYPIMTETSKPLHICDMPGFAETDPTKKITINILQKCFLTRVKNGTFLAVLNIDECFTVRPKTIVDAYHQPLMDLLGDKYSVAVDHLCFILTKNDGIDRPKRTSEELSNHIMRWGMEMSMASSNPLAVKLLYRIMHRHVFTDLVNDSREEVLMKIQRLTEYDKEQRSMSNRTGTFKIDSLEAGENELNQLCTMHLLDLLAQVQEKKEEAIEMIAEKEVLRGHLLRESTQMKEEKKQSCAEIAKDMEALRVVETRIENFKSDMDSAERRIVEAKENLESHNKLMGVIYQYMEKEDFINFRCDISRRVKTPMKKDKYSVKIIFRLWSPERVILAVKYEAGDDSIKSHIQRGDSLIPRSLKHIGQIKQESVIYNSVSQRNTCSAKTDEKNGEVSLEISIDEPFKVYIYTSRKFTEIEMYQALKSRCEADAAKQIAKVQESEKYLETRKEQYDADKDICRVMKETLAKKKMELENLKRKARDMQDSHREQSSRSTSDLEGLEEARTHCEEDPKKVSIGNIAKIFSENSIQNNLASLLSKFSSEHGKLSMQIAEAIAANEHFKTAQDEAMQDILISDW